MPAWTLSVRRVCVCALAPSDLEKLNHFFQNIDLQYVEGPTFVVRRGHSFLVKFS